MGKKKKQEKLKKLKEKEKHARHLRSDKKVKDKGKTEKRRAVTRKSDMLPEELPVSENNAAEVLESAVAASYFRALADENRIQILTLLKERELCAGDLLKSLSIVQSTLSHHMKILVESGIVKCRKQGKWSYYSIDSGRFRELRKFIDIYS